ncbi:PREDICTED: F-box protein CPR30-like [Fragaria vesca subsp. vesca]|uniref:F-box protein CPR30-like isoform X4 n=1 Tax=Fragaria vesca subsp. vesca TaxID=101020 RepID=UPI0002C34C2D|nr:PREDICTED: F-box protein CPR30-like isoform X4 [Fragaria vesca subsp. vesca]
MWEDCYEGKSLLSPASISRICSSIAHVFQNWLESLPEEIIPDILVRLPIKSLIRFTSVSKSWNSTIKHPTFIRTHLTHTLNSTHQNATRLILIHNVSNEGTSKHNYGQVPLSGFKEDSYSLHYDNTAVTEHCKIEFPIALKQMMLNPCFRVSGTYNGLVLLAEDVWHDVYNYVLWNPSIRKYVILPKPTVRKSTHGEYKASMGLGYDARKNDYKVVRVTFLVDQPDHSLTALVQYYSLATGSWGMLRVLPPCMLLSSGVLVFANGALHFLAVRGTDNHEMKCLLMGFDVGSESLREILLPESLNMDALLEFKLGASGDGKSIGLFVRCDTETDSYLDIWVMKEYFVQKSWAKLMILTPQGPERSLPKPICFRRSGHEVVLQLEDDRGLVSLDIVSKQFKSLGISAGLVCSVDSYEESLVLLDRKDAISY